MTRNAAYVIGQTIGNPAGVLDPDGLRLFGGMQGTTAVVGYPKGASPAPDDAER